MLRQMESVLCGRFAVTNKIADNLPFSPHRQQKTSIIVDFHGAAQCCPKRFSIKTKKGSKAKVERTTLAKSTTSFTSYGKYNTFRTSNR